jgi:sigma-B regulation protein RsbU (phosphoserine phosphatase)
MPESITVSTMRADLAEIVAATFMASLGVAAITLYVLRRRSADITPLAFACFTLLYAIRLAVSTDIVPVLAGGSEQVWALIQSGLTYVMLLPGVWFAACLIGPGWRGSLRWLGHILLVFAPVGIAGMFLTGSPEWAMDANNVLALLFLAAVAAGGAGRSTQSTRVETIVRAGVGFAGVFIVAENLRSIGVLSWPEDLEFVGLLGFVSSLAFAVADRFLRAEGRLAAVDRELVTARRIQQGILPERVPLLPVFDIAVEYVPMREVAGDFYDFLGVDHQPSSILIADVSGHGVPAALIASMVKVAAASHHEVVDRPDVFLNAVSGTLQGQLGGQFLTAMCLHLDPAHREIVCAGAGHPPLLHWHADDRRLTTVPSEGILIGFAPSPYTARRVSVGSGDRLFLYTDGVLEAASDTGEFFGDARFAAVIAGHASKSAAELARAIMDGLRQWRRQADGFDDDVTLIVVGVR